MTREERKQMTVQMAEKLERGHMLGRVYLSSEGLQRVLEMQGKSLEIIDLSEGISVEPFNINDLVHS